MLTISGDDETLFQKQECAICGALLLNRVRAIMTRQYYLCWCTKTLRRQQTPTQASKQKKSALTTPLYTTIGRIISLKRSQTRTNQQQNERVCFMIVRKQMGNECWMSKTNRMYDFTVCSSCAGATCEKFSHNRLSISIKSCPNYMLHHRGSTGTGGGVCSM